MRKLLLPFVFACMATISMAAARGAPVGLAEPTYSNPNTLFTAMATIDERIVDTGPGTINALEVRPVVIGNDFALSTILVNGYSDATYGPRARECITGMGENTSIGVITAALNTTQMKRCGTATTAKSDSDICIGEISMRHRDVMIFALQGKMNDDATIGDISRTWTSATR